MKITILTIFPDFFVSPLQTSIIKRAQQTGLVELDVINVREFTDDTRQTTDDRPFGGGPGMVMKVEPIYKALESLGALEKSDRQASQTFTILTSAKGELFTQPVAKKYAQLNHLIIICGHYEGVDERVAEHLIDQEVRIGDYVLTGGEAAAVVMTDAVTRLIPGVLGNEESNQDESHSEPGQLGYPQYTRPENFNGWSIPEVLLTGDHQKIKAWRQAQKSQAE